jgi:hypothetical protein
MIGAARLGRRRVGDDAGQVVTVLVVMMVLLLVSVVVSVLVPIGRAADLKERTQSAADASALAGAGDIRKEVLRRFGLGLADKSFVDNWVLCGSGRIPAADFAGRNNARVTRYCYLAAGDRVTVTVQGRTAVGGLLPTASAVAEVGIRWGSCRFRDDPPPALTTHWICGSLDVPFEVDPVTGRLTLDHTLPPGWLDQRLVPRLVP